MRLLLSLFSSVVLAAETIISPLPDALTFGIQEIVTTPAVSFGQLRAPTPTPSPTPSVLGVTIAEPTPTASPTPTIAPRRARKAAMTIAVLGDSMVDTLGPDFPHLKNKLAVYFPQTAFTILNYGVGATNIDYGLTRLTESYSYLGQNLPSLVSRQPDLVIVESFGYNPYSFDEGAMEKHWLQLATILSTLKSQIPGVRIVVAATIAPNSTVFGDGAPGISFDPIGKLERVRTIKKYLENAVNFARSQNYPLADAYHASLDRNGDGILTYINGGDHIHYSDAGRALMAQKALEAILTNKLLE